MDLEIDVYEKSNRIGGRIKNTIFDGNAIELGASIMISKNRYMSEFADFLGGVTCFFVNFKIFAKIDFCD